MSKKTAENKPSKIRHDRVFPIVNTIFLILLMIITLYPVLNTVAYSFNDGTDALRGNIGLLPRVFSLESYKSILSDVAVYDRDPNLYRGASGRARRVGAHGRRG